MCLNNYVYLLQITNYTRKLRLVVFGLCKNHILKFSFPYGQNRYADALKEPVH